MSQPMYNDHEIDEAWLYIQSALERWEAWASHYPPEHRIGHISDASIAKGYLRSFLDHARRDRETFREALAVLRETSEILTEMGWHADRGILERINEVIAKATGE